MAKAKKVNFDFEKGLIDLEIIVKKMEQGNIPLQEALDDYAQAIALLKNCQKTLEEAEQKVKILIGQNQDSPLVPLEIEENERA